MRRRDLFHATLAAGAASVLAPHPLLSSEASAQDLPEIIDTNINLFQWPTRRLPLDDVDTLVRKLRSLRINEAWAGSFEGILHRDLAGVNQRLARACRRHAELTPIGSINLELPGWERDLRQCAEDHHMPGIRLHPNYHGYGLAEDCFSKLLQQAADAGLFVQIAVAMEDTRTQHPLIQAADVDISPLIDVMPKVKNARVQLLNYRPRSPMLEKLSRVPGIYFDCARVEQTDGVAKLMEAVPAGRVMFGSHGPFLIPEAAMIRVAESALAENDLRSLLSAGAKQMRRKANT